jgi:hypothetical protein
MRNLLFLLILVGMTTSCGIFKKAAKTPAYVKKYFPTELQMLEFGMPLAEAVELRPGMQVTDNQGMDFRLVYLENMSGGDIESIGYYFDNEGEKPLYEFIINYKSEATRDQVASKLFGTPNYEETEWQYDSGEGFIVHAWTFKNKLVIVGILPNTEWAE